jgi:hypothetical protein
MFSDTLLNVFLAIAVDNLGQAQEMTAKQEEEEAAAREAKENNIAKEVNIFLPTEVTIAVPLSTSDKPNNKVGDKTNKPADAKPANNQKTMTQTAGATTTTAPAPVQSLVKRASIKLKRKQNVDVDVEEIATRKVDLDYIPGLDDDLKVILPASFEASLANKPPTDEEIEEERLEKKRIAEEIKAREQAESDPESGPRPMVPYSCMFIFSETNP